MANGRRGRLVQRLGAIAVVLGAVWAAPPAHSATPSDARARAADLVSAARQAAYATHPECAPRDAPNQLSGETHELPSDTMLDTVSAFRRPATPADADPSLLVVGPIEAGATYADHVRTVAAPNGQRFTLVIARSLPAVVPASPTCQRALASSVQAAVRRRPALRVEAERALRRARQELIRRAATRGTPTDLLYFYTGYRGERLRVLRGGRSAAEFEARGILDAAGGPSIGPRSILSAVFPDGVASVMLSYPRDASIGPDPKPKVYAKPYVRTVRIRDNVMSVDIPRLGGDVHAGRITWRDARGRVLRRAPL